MVKKITVAVGFLFLIVLLSIIVLYAAITPPNIKVPKQEDRIISGVTIWNPGETARQNQTIIIKQGMISEIRDTLSSDDVSLCKDCYVMPGLIDAHVHTPPRLAIGNQRLFSLLYLHYGVTSVRDTGQIDYSVSKLDSQISSGKIAGPRMYRCGPALDGSSPSFSGARSVNNEIEGRAIVQALSATGVDCIKVYDQLPASSFKGISAEAKKNGLPLVGHTPHSTKLSQITNFEVQHYTGIPYLNNAPPNGFAYLSQDLIDMSDAEIDEVIQLMKSNDISFLPTIANAKARLIVSAPERFKATKGVSHLPVFWQIAWPVIVDHAQTDEQITTELEAIPYALSFAAKARNNGIDVLVGTDVVMPYMVPGESIHLEIDILSKAFGSREMALQAATKINGQHIGQGKIGHLHIGAFADMLILKTDPRNDRLAPQSWSYLIVDGRLYNRTDMNKAIAKYDRHFNGEIYNSVFNFVYSKMLSSEYSHAGGEAE